MESAFEVVIIYVLVAVLNYIFGYVIARKKWKKTADYWEKHHEETYKAAKDERLQRLLLLKAIGNAGYTVKRIEEHDVLVKKEAADA